MGKSKVSVVIIDTYDEEKVYEAVCKGVNSIGGIAQFVKPDEKILVKPNYLSTSAPEAGIVTHPSVIKAVLRLLKESNYSNVTYGDSPMVGNSPGASAKIGLTDENTFGAKQADMSSSVHVDFPEGSTTKYFEFAKGVTEADAIINVCKMNTHMFEVITGAVKNVYGFIYGANKAKGHARFPNATIFARMLADIHRCIPCRLHIMDGIVAMEGNGPASGDLVNMNMLFFSSDPVALDTVFCAAIDLNPRVVPTNVQSEIMDIGTCDPDKIDLLVIDGDSSSEMSFSDFTDRYGKRDFDVRRDETKKDFLTKISDTLGKSRRPYIIEDRCIQCGLCVKHCPVDGGAVNFTNGKDKPPVYDYKKCIRCYCCQEACPQKAIAAKGK